jgi:ubiquinone/menaquinone biosynthesis C-methylase UbiE
LPAGFTVFFDKVAALGEIRRVLTPNGRIALNVWCLMQYSPAYVVLTKALELSIVEFSKHDQASLCRSAERYLVNAHAQFFVEVSITGLLSDDRKAIYS